MRTRASSGLAAQRVLQFLRRRHFSRDDDDGGRTFHRTLRRTRYTIGSGRSGGSMQQHLLAQNYPGLLDGLIPTAAFADTLDFYHSAVKLRTARLRCLIRRHRRGPEEQKTAVAGEANWLFCARNETPLPLLRPTSCHRTGVPADQVYERRTNPKGHGERLRSGSEDRLRAPPLVIAPKVGGGAEFIFAGTARANYEPNSLPAAGEPSGRGRMPRSAPEPSLSRAAHCRAYERGAGRTEGGHPRRRRVGR